MTKKYKLAIIIVLFAIVCGVGVNSYLNMLTVTGSTNILELQPHSALITEEWQTVTVVIYLKNWISPIDKCTILLFVNSTSTEHFTANWIEANPPDYTEPPSGFWSHDMPDPNFIWDSYFYAYHILIYELQSGSGSTTGIGNILLTQSFSADKYTVGGTFYFWIVLKFEVASTIYYTQFYNMYSPVGFNYYRDQVVPIIPEFSAVMLVFVLLLSTAIFFAERKHKNSMTVPGGL